LDYANSIFLSEQISHQQLANSTFSSQQISTSHQPNEHAGPVHLCLFTLVVVA
jgi:hypothetical protein